MFFGVNKQVSIVGQRLFTSKARYMFYVGPGVAALREILWRHSMLELNGKDKPAHLRLCLSPRHFRNGSVRVETDEILRSVQHLYYVPCHTSSSSKLSPNTSHHSRLTHSGRTLATLILEETVDSLLLCLSFSSPSLCTPQRNIDNESTSCGVLT